MLAKATYLFKRRLIVTIIFFVLLLISLLTRLFYLQVWQHQYYVTQSKNNRIELLPISPRRGLIFDRNGVLLAENVPGYSLVVTPSKVHNLQETIEGLSHIISISPEEQDSFSKQLKQHRRFQQVPLKIKLTEEEVARFAVNRYKFPGVQVMATLLRYYPFKNTLVQTVGYVGRINAQDLENIDLTNYAGTNFIGKVGIEKYYESMLHGVVGYKKVEIDAAGNTIRTLDEISPTEGKDIYLTIDSRLQMAAEKALKGNRAALVAIDPDNGQVLAFVSQPSYDPNVFVAGISQKDYGALQNDPDYPLFNRAIQGLYSPGSTIKPFVALALLDSKVVTPEFQIFDPGWYRLPNTKHIYYDYSWRKGGHGWVNLSKAIIVSCDTYFYQLSPKLGIDNMDAMLRQFGFGQRTGIDMPAELMGNIPTPEWKMKYRGGHWYTGDTIITSIGQGFFQVTPLQMAQVTATLAAQGQRFVPYLLYATKDSDGQMQYQKDSAEEPVILDNPQNWEVVSNAMGKVVSQGTGYHYGRPSYTIAAKTGTAQLVRMHHGKKEEVFAERLRDNSIFIAFAPIDKPKIAVAVVVENSTVPAAVVARKVIDAYLTTDKTLH